MKRYSASQSLVFSKEFFHLSRVTSKDNNNISALILHFLDNGVDCFVTVEPASILDKRIRLVYE